MMVKRLFIVFLTLTGLHVGCALQTGQEEVFSSSDPVTSIDVDIQAKREYLEHIKGSLKVYQNVILDVKYYHYRNNFKELAREIDQYVDTYVKNILIDSDLNSSLDIKLEVAKIHLLVTSIYLDINQRLKALEYLGWFRDRYHSDAALLGKALNPSDIG